MFKNYLFNKINEKCQIKIQNSIYLKKRANLSSLLRMIRKLFLAESLNQKEVILNKNTRFIIITFLFITLFNNFCYARYTELINSGSYYATIAEPYFVVIPIQETYVFEANKQNINKEYFFIVKNYDDNNKKASEVDLEFDIEISLSNTNFPVSYKLFDCTTNEELLLDNSNKTQKIFIGKNILFERQYKLVTSWCDKQNMSENVEIYIIINSSQRNERR